MQTRQAVAQFPQPGRSRNPYAELLYGPLAECGIPRGPLPDFTLAWLWRARRRVAFLHFHWRPDRYYAPCLFAERDPGPRQRARTLIQVTRFAWLLAAARLLRYRIVWTVHEVYPPRPSSAGRRIDRVGQGLLARASSVVLAHDRAVAQRLRTELGATRLQIEIVPHGSFIGAYPAGRSVAELRSALGIPSDAFVYLCFGQLRADKQVGLLLDAFARLRSPDARLVVAGLPDDQRSRRLVEEAARADFRIMAMLEAVPHERVAELFEMADVFVLARSESWTSGSLILALSLGLPVVAARLASTAEAVGGEDAGWLFDPGDVDSLAEALGRAALDPAVAIAKGEAARAVAEALPTWQEIAGNIAGLLLNEDRGEQRYEPVAHLLERERTSTPAASRDQMCAKVGVLQEPEDRVSRWLWVPRRHK